MACTHRRDGTWSTDLLWYYTHDTTTPLGDTTYTKSWFDSWHGRPDPANAKNERHKVFELLLDIAQPADWRDSKVPWNQENRRFTNHMESKGFKGLFCGASVKIFLNKYMKCGDYPVRQLPSNEASVEAACKQILKSLQNKTAVIVGLGHRKGHVSHYVGIVGHKKITSGPVSSDHFLFIEPYGDDGWGTLEYGFRADGSRGRSSFLGELKHDTGRHELVYVGKIVDYCVKSY